MEFVFEWDPDKAERNLKNHGVSFEEAKTVFNDPNALTTFDEFHSTEDEDRWITVGRSDLGSILRVVHVDRERVIRLVSARRANRLDRTRYHDAQ